MNCCTSLLFLLWHMPRSRYGPLLRDTRCSTGWCCSTASLRVSISSARCTAALYRLKTACTPLAAEFCTGIRMTVIPKKIQIIVTLGPATLDGESLRLLKAKGVDFVRVNMSHSSLKDLKRAIALSKKAGIPFIIDTEGSQVRTGPLKEGALRFEVGETVHIYRKPVAGSKEKISLTPSF